MEDYKCPKCQKSDYIKFIRKKPKELVFFCKDCQLEFIVKDENFGYLPMRMANLRKKYP